MTHAAELTSTHRDGTFIGMYGLPLYYQAWRPLSVQPRAVLVNLHGLGDHSSLYPSIAAHFPSRGIAVYAYDMRGNGRSPGQRAYVGRWEEYPTDLHAFLSKVRGMEGMLPVFLLGNSLGGLVVLD